VQQRSSAPRSAAWSRAQLRAGPCSAPGAAQRLRALLRSAASCLLTACASQAPAELRDFAQRLRTFEATLGASTGKGYYKSLHNLRGFIDYTMPRDEYALLDPDIRAHKKITSALCDRFVGWLNSVGAPPSQFKKYANALVWGQKVRVRRAAVPGCADVRTLCRR
jgi:hypothetical protein